MISTTPNTPSGKHCSNCKHYRMWREQESWEMSHIFWYERRCDVKPGVHNLVNFPFYNTKCKEWTDK